MNGSASSVYDHSRTIFREARLKADYPTGTAANATLIQMNLSVLCLKGSDHCVVARMALRSTRIAASATQERMLKDAEPLALSALHSAVVTQHTDWSIRGIDVTKNLLQS